MKVLMINAVCGTGSTGRICTDLARKYESEGHEVKIAYGRFAEVPEDCQKYALRIGGKLDVNLHALLTRFTDRHGFGSTRATRAFLRLAEDYAPDLLWLHNLHGYYINVELLFQWIKSHPEMEVKWTLHDCWSFTGHCSHFSFVGCNRWQNQCHNCPQSGRYPASFIDGSKSNYQRKKAAFTGVSNLTVYTPSQWLKNLTEKSFLGCYPIEVMHNPINREVFCPTPGDFRKKYALTDKKIILGVASSWDDRKGLPDFIALSSLLDPSYQIVLVGLTPKQMSRMPRSILCIPRTESAAQLAEIYTAADLFLNPSREETFGMTTAEARCCGTDAIVYKNTACEEIVRLYGGTAVDQNLQALVEAVHAHFA